MTSSTYLASYRSGAIKPLNGLHDKQAKLRKSCMKKCISIAKRYVSFESWICMKEQECIPVGCVPSVLYRTGGGSLSRRGVSVREIPPCGQNDWHTPVKILPCPKLRLRAVKTKDKLVSQNSESFSLLGFLLKTVHILLSIRWSGILDSAFYEFGY